MDKHGGLDSDQQSDSGESRESGDGSSSGDDEDDDEDEEELDKEEQELNRRAQMTTEELMVVARARAAEGKFGSIYNWINLIARCRKWRSSKTARRPESVRYLPRRLKRPHK